MYKYIFQYKYSTLLNTLDNGHIQTTDGKKNCSSTIELKSNNKKNKVKKSIKLVKLKITKKNMKNICIKAYSIIKQFVFNDLLY